MSESKNAKANTVSSKNQLTDDKRITIVREEGSKHKVLFVGNSITRHAPKPSIGWEHDWGMAASAKEKDYVHLVVKGLKERYGTIDYCIAQMADWECQYTNTEEILNEYYQPAREFGADIVIIRICENIKAEMHEEVSCKPYFDQMIRFMVTDATKQVIVTDSFWRKDSIEQVILEIIEERGYTYCKLKGLELDERTMAFGLFEHQGVAAHPGDYGMACIAERILECVL